MNMAHINPTISVIMLNVNGLNAPMKIQIARGPINTTQLYVVYKKPTLNLKTHRLKLSERRKIDYANTNQK